MKPLVSVIIPNYNEEKYLEKCIDSVLKQTYSDIEIIVIDDGSSDASISILERYAQEFSQITLLHQNHQNAAVARNKGMDIAKGDYYLFLDSDDILCHNSVEMMMDAYCRDEQIDFVMGNMAEMDANGKEISRLLYFQKPEFIEDYTKLVSFVPAPSNKLYKASVVRQNNICFANVRIGQDLNFYLKYLACCNHIYVIPNIIYFWRDTVGSMSRKANLNILDIVECFRDVKKFYSDEGEEERYYLYIQMIEFHNYYRQMDKQTLFPEKRIRRIIVDFFSYNISQLKQVKNTSNYGEFSDEYNAYRKKMAFRWIYCSNIYRKMKKIQ